ncbi:hypothetical protein D1AOALGA4SA_6300 [Olavius algarvensis Delta 1 endosymbiont]|nr:hypothetical protein D1AOALGA4SA_6300 [Olavius algarvensis Delta 1 endosymbiont]
MLGYRELNEVIKPSANTPKLQYSNIPIFIKIQIPTADCLLLGYRILLPNRRLNRVSFSYPPSFARRRESITLKAFAGFRLSAPLRPE